MQAGLVGIMVKKLGERACMVYGMLCGCVGFFIFGFASTGLMFMFGIPLIALWGIAGPAIQSQMSRRVQANEQGQLQGAVASIRGITGVIGPFVMNGTFALTAGKSALIELPGMVYYLAAMLVAFTLLVAWAGTQARSVLATE